MADENKSSFKEESLHINVNNLEATDGPPTSSSRRKRVSIQSDNLRPSKSNNSLKYKQSNFSSPQLINQLSEHFKQEISNNNKIQSNLKKMQMSNGTSIDENLKEAASDTLINEINTITLSILNSTNNPDESKDVKELIIYTKGMPLPKKIDVLRETRFILRFLEFIFSAGSFISLSVSSSDANYKSSIIASSGINIMCLVSISTIIVSFATMFVYCNPRILNVPPQRHYRFSRVEVCVDFVCILFWVFASSQLAIVGYCPQKLFDINAKSEHSCYSWNFCMGFGFVVAVLYLTTFFIGLYDLKTHSWGKSSATEKYSGKGVHLWVRGNWNEVHDERD